MSEQLTLDKIKPSVNRITQCCERCAKVHYGKRRRKGAEVWCGKCDVCGIYLTVAKAEDHQEGGR